MKQLGLTIAAAVLAAMPAFAGEPPDARLVDVAALVRSVNPAVVNVAILKQRAMENGQMPEGEQAMVGPEREVGSGFIIEPDGHIVTNRHVIAGAYSITVTTADGFSYPGRVLSTNEKPDLAMLKIDADHPLPTVPWGDSDKLAVGDTVIAIGNPLGLSNSVSVGVVSALHRNVDVTVFDDLIQTDAAINHGNSGGPLFNAKGEVVGVNWALIEWEKGAGSVGLGLSIPSNMVSFVIDQMDRYGQLRPGWLGVTMQTVTYDLALAAGRTAPGGALIGSINPASPAGKTLQVGDIVLSFAGRPTPDLQALARHAGSQAPGSTVPATVWRNRGQIDIEVEVGTWPPGPDNPVGEWHLVERGDRMSQPTMGMQLVPVTDAVRTQFKVPAGEQGVVVTSVAANSPGADAGFARGDVILRVQDMPVTDMDNLHAAMERVRAERRPSVLVLVRQGDYYLWRAVPTDVK